MKKGNSLLILCSALLLSACEMLDIQPVGEVIPNTLQEYRALLANAYRAVPDDRGLTSFRSDEMYVKDDNRELEKYSMIETWDDYSAAGTTSTFQWDKAYTALYTANFIIEKHAEITEGSVTDVNQLIGECYLLRAFLHFQLVNLYGQPYTKPGAVDTKAIPLKLDTDIDKILTKNTVGEIYRSILSDLDEAEKLINKEEWERIFSYRFNTLSVPAMRSRVYLYMGDWASARRASEAVLAKKSTLEDFNTDNFMLPNHFQSAEAINALERVMGTNFNQAASASEALLSMYGEGDLRPAAYFKTADKDGYRFSLKGGKDDFRCSFRVGEMYLNDAEAAVEEGDLPSARTRLLQLMKKRYTPDAYRTKETAVNNMAKDALLKEVLDERARELAFEGHRWFDLRRTTRPRIEKQLRGKTYVLEQDDVRYTNLIPKDAIAANPELAN